jgi:hypothetical protein
MIACEGLPYRLRSSACVPGKLAGGYTRSTLRDYTPEVMRISQAESERIVFDRFAGAAQLRVIPGTVENRQPPEPDIYCEIEGLGLVGFELVEIIDSDLARFSSDQISVEAALNAASASPDLAAYSNALIFVRYVDDASARRRRDAIPSLFAFLRTLAPGFAGDIRIPAGDALARVVRSIGVTRGTFQGPHFQVEAGGFIGDPIVDRVAGKLTKQYGTAHRLELLGYYESHPVAPGGGMWMKSLESYVQGQLAASQFSRVWIFDVGQDRILFRSDASA